MTSIHGKNTDNLLSYPLSTNQKESLQCAVNTADQIAVAHIIEKDCKSVFVAVKKLILNDNHFC